MYASHNLCLSCCPPSYSLLLITQSDRKVAGHSPSQYITGVVDRKAPDIVIVILREFSNSAQDFINKQITMDGYETNRQHATFQLIM